MFLPHCDLGGSACPIHLKLLTHSGDPEPRSIRFMLLRRSNPDQLRGGVLPNRRGRDAEPVERQQRRFRSTIMLA
jgi:hypothetical protein